MQEYGSSYSCAMLPYAGTGEQLQLYHAALVKYSAK